MPQLTRPLLSHLLATLLVVQAALAFQSPLSDESVREAYFLGQRHDGSFPSLLEKYTKHFQPPKTGPYISSVVFLTPYVQLVQYSDQYLGNYSAQQAELDYRGRSEETVQIIVEIQLTNSYGAFIPYSSNARSSSPSALVRRRYDFWKNFQVTISDGKRLLSPSSSNGQSNYSCDRHGPCVMTGATLEFDVPADAFTSDSATIQIDPPEGQQAIASFDLDSLR